MANLRKSEIDSEPQDERAPGDNEPGQNVVWVHLEHSEELWRAGNTQVGKCSQAFFMIYTIY